MVFPVKHIQIVDMFQTCYGRIIVILMQHTYVCVPQILLDSSLMAPLRATPDCITTFHVRLLWNRIILFLVQEQLNHKSHLRRHRENGISHTDSDGREKEKDLQLTQHGILLIKNFFIQSVLLRDNFNFASLNK